MMQKGNVQSRNHLLEERNMQFSPIKKSKVAPDKLEVCTETVCVLQYYPEMPKW